MYPSYNDIQARFDLANRSEVEMARKLVEEFRHIVAKEMEKMMYAIDISLDNDISADFYLNVQAAQLIAEELKEMGFRSSVTTRWHGHDFDMSLKIELRSP